ncbi:hypothetical protein [Kitasatospora sp. GP82]|uniref:hypothetical protein n=1 Tax=Kitasatospora sp. GP82 TaxID=3035089 RepID=UPI002473443B|nr:hypothetical protein [Kitasatospora sp. GP82]MDH6123657.1 hypothetical protein [Kitasatospora sp. GP82]
MHSPPDEETRLRMEAAHANAAALLGLTCTSAPVWGFLGCTISRRASDLWLRVASTAKANAGRKQGEGSVGASVLVSDDVPRPRLHDVLDWTDDTYAYKAEVADYVPHPVISPDRPDLAHDPGLPDEWWGSLRRALHRLGQAEGVRITVRSGWIDKAFPQFLGIPAPEKIERVTGHGDLHWGNLTAPLALLDWERWGRVPVGYDPGLLHANSLLVPGLAARIRDEFSSILGTPAGRIGELAALAEMLQAVARGWYPELAPLLAERATELTDVQPPVAEHSEITA